MNRRPRWCIIGLCCITNNIKSSVAYNSKHLFFSHKSTRSLWFGWFRLAHAGHTLWLGSGGLHMSSFGGSVWRDRGSLSTNIRGVCSSSMSIPWLKASYMAQLMSGRQGNYSTHFGKRHCKVLYYDVKSWEQKLSHHVWLGHCLLNWKKTLGNYSLWPFASWQSVVQRHSISM